MQWVARADQPGHVWLSVPLRAHVSLPALPAPGGRIQLRGGAGRTRLVTKRSQETNGQFSRAILINIKSFSLLTFGLSGMQV